MSLPTTPRTLDQPAKYINPARQAQAGQPQDNQLAALQMLQGILEQNGVQQQALLKQAQTPVGKIAQAAGNGPVQSHGLQRWYDLNPTAVQGETYAQFHANQQAGMKFNPDGSPKATPSPEIAPTAVEGPGAPQDPGGAHSGLAGLFQGLVGMFGGGGAQSAAAPQSAVPAAVAGPTPPAASAGAGPVERGGIVGPVGQPIPPSVASLGDTSWQPPQDNLAAPPQSNVSALQGLTNLTGLGSAGIGQVAQGVSGVANNLGLIANHANQALAGASTQYANALNTVGKGQQALAAGNATAGELSGAMRAGNLAHQGLTAAESTAATAQNAARLPTGLAGLVGTGSKFATAAKVAGKVATPLQVAMMAVEGGRLLGDQKFRDQAKADYENLANKGAGGRVWQSLGAPLSTAVNHYNGLYDMKTSMDDAVTSIERLDRSASNTKSAMDYRKNLVKKGLSSKEIQIEMSKFRRKQNRK